VTKSKKYEEKLKTKTDERKKSGKCQQVRESSPCIGYKLSMATWPMEKWVSVTYQNVSSVSSLRQETTKANEQNEHQDVRVLSGPCSKMQQRSRSLVYCLVFLEKMKTLYCFLVDLDDI